MLRTLKSYRGLIIAWFLLLGSVGLMVRSVLFAEHAHREKTAITFPYEPPKPAVEEPGPAPESAKQETPAPEMEHPSPAAESPTEADKEAPADEAKQSAAEQPPPASAAPATQEEANTSQTSAFVQEAPEEPLPMTPPTDATTEPKKTQVYLLIQPVGNKNAVLEALIKDFPAAINIASQYDPGVTDLLTRAHEKGHTLLLRVPMQSLSPQDNAGPTALHTGLTAKENQHLLEEHLMKMPQAVGVMNYFGSQFLSSKPHVTMLFSALKDKKLIFCEDYVTPRSVIKEVSSTLSYKAYQISYVLDFLPGRRNFDKELEQMTPQLSNHEALVILIKLHPQLAPKLLEWLEKVMKQDNIELRALNYQLM